MGGESHERAHEEEVEFCPKRRTGPVVRTRPRPLTPVPAARLAPDDPYDRRSRAPRSARSRPRRAPRHPLPGPRRTARRGRDHGPPRALRHPARARPPERTRPRRAHTRPDHRRRTHPPRRDGPGAGRFPDPRRPRRCRAPVSGGALPRRIPRPTTPDTPPAAYDASTAGTAPRAPQPRPTPDELRRRVDGFHGGARRGRRAPGTPPDDRTTGHGDGRPGSRSGTPTGGARATRRRTREPGSDGDGYGAGEPDRGGSPDRDRREEG